MRILVLARPTYRGGRGDWGRIRSPWGLSGLEKRPPSPADTEPLDDRAIPIGVVVLEIFEEPATLADQHQESATRMVVLRVLLEVLGEPVDPLGQERDLHLGRAGVALVNAVLLDQGFLLVDGQRHREISSNRRVQGSERSARTGSKHLVLSAITPQRTMGGPPSKVGGHTAGESSRRAASTSRAIWARNSSTPPNFRSPRRRVMKRSSRAWP